MLANRLTKFLFFLQISCTIGYRILVYSPSLSHSHLISCARVADALARDGHNVTLLEVEFNVPLEVNFSMNSNRTIRVAGPFYHFDFNGMDYSQMLAKQAFEPTSLYGSIIRRKMFQTSLNEACEKFVTTQKALIEGLKAEKFDLIIEEQLNFCGAGLGHLVGIPTHILVSSCPLQEHVASLLGLPYPASYVPSVRSRSSDKMTIFERFHNILLQFVGYAYIWYGIDPLTQIFRKHFGNDFPDLRQIVSESPFVFVNVDELVDFPRPIFPNIVYIGGLGVENTPSKGSLKEPFKSEMAKGNNGVIFVSFGSNIRSTDLSKKFRKNFIETFGEFADYHFIVRIEKEDNLSTKYAENFENIFLTQWAPQAELLAHPRLRLFITHGGYNSVLEAAHAGVPLVTMGFFADQYRNARVAERNGWALSFDKRALLKGKPKFRATIEEILTNPRYQIGAKRIRKLIETKPFSAEERLTKSIRFLEQNGGKLPELLSESRNLGTMALYNFDLALISAILSAILLLAMFILAKFLKKMVIEKLFNRRPRMKPKAN